MFKKLRNKFILIYTLVILIAGWVVWYVLVQFFNDNHFYWYPVIPVYYWVLGVSFFHIMTRVKKDNPKHLVNIYQMAKMAKGFISLIFIFIIYLIFSKEHIRDFIVVFAVFYIIYLTVETFYFQQFERLIKNDSLKND